MFPKVRIAGNNYPLVPLVFTTLVCIMLVYLGNWQLKRLDEKEKLISKISQNITSAPINVEVNDLKDAEQFSKISILGNFTGDKHIFLYGRRSGTTEKDGYYVLTPFKLSSSNNVVVLVSRGWAPQSIKKKIEAGELKLPVLNEKITGILMPGEMGQMLMPKNDVERNIWFYIDLNLASKTHGVNFTKFYLRQIDNENLPDGMVPLFADNLSKIRNDHLEYALTWYSLAGALIIIFFVYFRNYKH